MAPHFAGLEGCLVLRDLRTGAESVFNPERAAVRFSPCSTFKIPNSLIALEDTVLTGPDDSLAWDGVRRSREVLNQDHTLRSAMSHSVVWFYQEIARRTGEARYRDWLAQMDYGNRDIAAGLTEFWLDTSLQISAREQIEFLAKLHAGRLPFSKRSVDLVREIMTQQQTETFAYLGKTGSADRPGDEPDLGWWVGLLDFADGRAFAFACNISGKDAYGPTARRITEAILREQALLPPQP